MKAQPFDLSTSLQLLDLASRVVYIDGKSKSIFSDAEYYLKLGKFEKAISVYDLALNRLNVQLRDNRNNPIYVQPSTVGNPLLAGIIELHKAKVLFELSVDPNCKDRNLVNLLLDSWEAATASKILIETVRADKIKFGDEENTFIIARLLRPTYDLMIEVAYRLRNTQLGNQIIEFAFNCSLESRNRTFMDILWAKRQINVNKNYNKIYDDVLTKNALLSEVALSGALSRALMEESEEKKPDQQIILKISQKLTYTQSRIRYLQQKIMLNEPNFTLEDIEKKYPDMRQAFSFRRYIGIRSSLIQYHFTDRHVFAFIMKEVGDIKLIELSISPEELTTSVRDYVSELKRHQAIWKPNSTMLYIDLLSEIMPHLSGSDQLYIVPTGILHYLPFNTLVNPISGNEITQSFSITYLPHPWFLSLSAKPKSSDRSSSVLLVGIKNFSTKKMLNFSESEVLEVEKLFQNKSILLLGSRGNATKKNILNQLSDRNRIVHISSHASFEKKTSESGIIVNDLYNRDDIITAFDILGIEQGIYAELMVLSACETGQGRLGAEDDILALPRALLLSGSQAVIASLWSVEEESTKLLMTQFYKELMKPSVSVEKALQRAQAWLRKNYAQYDHPYFWAPFVLIGNGRYLSTLDYFIND